AAGAHEKQKRSGGDHAIADRKLAAAGKGCHGGESHRAEIPGDGEHAEKEAGVADAVNDKGFVGGCAGGMAVKEKSNQQVRAETHTFPANEQDGVVVPQNESEHGEHE